MAANLPRDLLTARRDREQPGLQFVALLCVLRILIGRHFLIEHIGTSKILKESPLQILAQVGLHVGKLDQCMYGAEQENRHIQKSILFVFDCPQTGLYICFDRSHTHLPLRGQGPKGSRTAAAAMYPKELCDSILANIANMRTTSQDEGRKKLPDKPPHTFAVLAGSDNFSKYDKVLHRLQELRSIATTFGFAYLVNTLVPLDSRFAIVQVEYRFLHVLWQAV